ncbi:hyccin [Atheta coriaria]|uniref:hyccin n=1 Tax=Dalotia coriaria TaxID=877792 RepID=UPI0031F438B4
MADVLVTDWIEEYEALTESEIITYAGELEHKDEVIESLHAVFTDPCYHREDTSIIDKVCQQLLAFYRSGDNSLSKFAIQFVPDLAYLHLSDRKSYPAVETLIISLYNLEVIDSNLQPKVKSFRVPSIAQSSLYHDSSNLEPAFIAENSLRRWEECNTKLVNWGPLPQIDALNAQNRQRVITALIFIFNQQVANVSCNGLEHTCRIISRLITQGFQSGGNRTSADSDNLQHSTAPRIPVSSQLMLEFAHTVYHALERGANGAAQTLHDIIQRASYETFTDVLLVTYSVSNLLQRAPTPNMPLKVMNKQINKSMITNASFRTKKLPDDIPIQEDEGGAGDASLDSIVEEGGAEASDKKGFRGRSGSALKHLPKLHGLGKKPKLKNSPTPPRHSLEDTPSIEIRMNTQVSATAAGDQVSLVASNSNGSMQNELTHNTVHVSTV